MEKSSSVSQQWYLEVPLDPGYKTGDRVGFVFDLKNGEVFYSKNGFWFPKVPWYWVILEDCFGFLWYDRAEKEIITPFSRRVQEAYARHMEFLERCTCTFSPSEFVYEIPPGFYPFPQNGENES